MINTGGPINRLAVVAQGASLRFYINGWLVAEEENRDFEEGEVALWAGASVLGDVRLVFDDVSVYQPVATPTPTPTLTPTPAPALSPTATAHAKPTLIPTRRPTQPPPTTQQPPTQQPPTQPPPTQPPPTQPPPAQPPTPTPMNTPPPP